MTKKPKLISSIRAKLVSAVAMLLVAVIMVVSSTYAWFTLSTAPEVTGISTSIGANGSLEMALVPADGDLDSIKTSSGNLSFPAANLTWGNLLDLSDGTSYGLDKITLYPSQLALNDAGLLDTSTGAFLSVPVYGPDGRVQNLSNKDTITGTWSNTAFLANSDLGVRGVGTASGMTERQLTFRNARSAANTAMQQAKNTAATSLNTNGSALANIAIKRAGSTTATYTLADVTALEKIVDDLLGTGTTETGALEYIEEAYKQIILAYMASSLGQGADPANPTISDEVVAGLSNTLDNTALSDLMDNYGDKMPSFVVDGYEAYAATLEKVEQAKENITLIREYVDAVVAADTTGNTKAESVPITWGPVENQTPAHPGMSATLHLLADTDSMEINGVKAGEITQGDNMSTLVNSVASGGVKVTMKSGGGVYADIADHCGDYSASVTIEEVSYNGLTLKNMTATMETINNNVVTIKPESATGAGDAQTTTSPYLVYLNTTTETISPSAGAASATAAPITEMYGYVLDLAFKTNASESNLLLQTGAADRIYNDNASDSDTMGQGSTMSFKSSNVTNFTINQVVELMKNIRIVLFDTKTGEIFGYAKLYMDDIPTTTVDGKATYVADAEGYVTAKMYMYETTIQLSKNDDGHIVKTEATDEIKYYVYDGKYYTSARTGAGTDADPYVYGTEVTLTSVQADAEVAKEVETKLTGKDAVITALTQNVPQAVSVLVYLDGENVGNEDVAADVASSMTGKMNIQFASSATLVPMEYSDFHVTAPSEIKEVTQGTTTTSIATTNAASYEGTLPTGWSVSDAGEVTIPADAAADTSVTIYAKDSNGATLKIWTVKVKASS